MILATSDYDDPNTWPSLQLASEIAVWTQWLCEAALGDRRFEPFESRLAANPTYFDVVSALADTGGIRPSDAVVLIATGHGVDIDHAHRLALRNADRSRAEATMVRTGQLLGWLKDTGAQHVFVVIDTCQSGAISREVFDFAQGLPRGWVGVATSSAWGSARVGAVTDAVTKVLHPAPGDDRNGSELQPFLSPRALIDAIVDAVGDQDIVVFPRYPRDEPSPCLPNPRYVTKYSDQVATAPSLQDVALRRDDLAVHWGPRSRGVRQDGKPGWLFTGRTAAMTAVIGAARGAPGAYVVCGGAGCGKSAVLSRLVTLSDRRFRLDHANLVAALNLEVCPAEGDVTVAVLAQGRSNSEIVDRIAEGLGVDPVDDDPDATLDRISEHLAVDASNLVTVVVDAVDEAVTPWSLVRSVLMPLCADWTQPTLRLILGVRSTPGDDGGRSPTLSQACVALLRATKFELDHDEYWDGSDLASYVAELLTSSDGNQPSPYGDEPSLVPRHAQAIANLVGRSYLLAQVVALSLSVRDAVQDPDDPRWRELVTQGLGTVLAEELTVSFDSVDVRTRVVSVLQSSALAFGQGVPWRRVWPAMATAVAAHETVIGDEDIRDLLRHRFGAYLSRGIEDGETVYRPFHDSMRAALLSPTVRRAVDGDDVGASEVSIQQLHNSVVRGLTGMIAKAADQRPVWDDAPPYVRRSLADHAAAAGELTELLRDPGFVLLADPRRLAATVSAARGPTPDPVLSAVLRSLDVLRDPRVDGRAGYLRLAALVEGAADLARIDETAALWSPKWTRWRQATPGALIAEVGSSITALAVARSFGGAVLIIASQDGAVRAVDATTGEKLWSLYMERAVNVGSLSSDKTLFAVSLVDGDVVVLEAEDGMEVGRVYGAGVTAVAVARDDNGIVVVTGTYNESLEANGTTRSKARFGVVRYWRLDVGSEPLWTVPLFGSGVRYLELAEDQPTWTVVAAGDPYGEPHDGSAYVRLLASDGRVVHSWAHSARGVMASARWVPRRSEIFVSAYDAVCRWRPDDGNFLVAVNPRRPGHADSIVSFERAGQEYVVLAGWNELILLECETLERLDHRGAAQGSVKALAVWDRESEPYVYSGDDRGDVRAWTLDSLCYPVEPAEQVHAFAVDEAAGKIFTLSQSANGQSVLTSLDLVTGGLTMEQPATDATCLFLASADGLLLIGRSDGTFQARRSADLTHVWTEQIHDAEVTDARVLERLLVSVGMDHAVRCTRVSDGQPLCPPARHTGWRDKGFEHVEIVGGRVKTVVASGIYSGLVWWQLPELLAGQPFGLRGEDAVDNDASSHMFAHGQGSGAVTLLTRLRFGGVDLLVRDGFGSPSRLDVLVRPGETVSTAHESKVTAFSQNAQFAWTGDSRGTIRAWMTADLIDPLEPATPRLEVRLGSSVRALHALADGGLIVATSAGLLRLDTAVHRPRHRHRVSPKRR